MYTYETGPMVYGFLGPWSSPRDYGLPTRGRVTYCQALLGKEETTFRDEGGPPSAGVKLKEVWEERGALRSIEGAWNS